MKMIYFNLFNSFSIYKFHKFNPKQAGEGIWRPPPVVFFCPSTLIFETITVKFCDVLMNRNLKDFFLNFFIFYL